MSSTLPLDPTPAGDLLSAALRSTRDAEVFWAREEAVTAACVNDREQAQRHEAEAINLRVISAGRFGHATHLGSATRLDGPGLMRKASAAAAQGRPAPATFWKEREGGIDVATFDEDVAALTEADLRHLARQATARLRDLLGDDVPVQVAVRRLVRRTLLMTRMSERHTQKTILQLQAHAGPDPQTGASFTETWATCRMPDDPLAALGNIAWRARAGRTVTTAPEGRCRLVAGPRAVAVLLRWLSDALTGTAILEKRSPFDASQLGRIRAVDERLTVIDNPLRPWAAPSGAYDAEGLPRVRRTLIDAGVVTNLLLDLSSASQLELEPTASATRTLDTPPLPAPSFLELAPGSAGFEALLESAEGGVYIDTLLERNAPEADGSFTLEAASAFRIRGGRPHGLVEGLQLSANLYELFDRQVLNVGGDRLASPSACCGSIAFGDVSTR